MRNAYDGYNKGLMCDFFRMELHASSEYNENVSVMKKFFSDALIFINEM